MSGPPTSLPAFAAGGDDEPRPRSWLEMYRMLEARGLATGFPGKAGPVPSMRERLEASREMLEALELQIGVLRREVEALDQTLFPEAEIEQAWSPRPVLGYRVWQARQGQFQGARRTWATPALRAECVLVSEGGDGGIPHTDGRCGRFGRGGCGIYALKDPGRLAAGARPWIRLADGTVFGLVALTGKVVEHEAGYRAAQAQVVAAAVLSVGKLSWGANQAWIEDLFARPASAHSPRHGLSGEPPQRRDLDGYTDDGLVRRLIADYLRDEARRHEQTWT